LTPRPPRTARPRGQLRLFLVDDEKLRRQTASLAKTEGIKKCVLSIDNPAGPKGYNVRQEAGRYRCALQQTQCRGELTPSRRATLNEAHHQDHGRRCRKILEQKK